MNQVFINEALTKAINDYQISKSEINGIKYNSFLTVVIRTLVTIYNELDILNPYQANNKEALIENLTKFGYSRVDLDKFFQNLENFNELEKEKERTKVFRQNPYLYEIEKELIDMLICKKMNFHLTEKEVKDFFELLYSPSTPNPLRVSFNYINMTPNVWQVVEYFNKQMQENVKIIEPKEKNILNLKAYEILNYNIDMINEEIDKLNHEVYDYFKIRENAINKEYLLEKEIDEIEKEKNKVTSGNGYVDILLIMSVICTTIMLVAVVAFLVV